MYWNISVPPVVQEEVVLQAHLMAANKILKLMIAAKGTLEANGPVPAELMEWANQRVEEVLHDRQEICDQIEACKLRLRVN